MGQFFRQTTSNPIIGNYPEGIYRKDGMDMHMGLPLPRVETLPNGTEFYVNKGPDGFLRYLSNDIRSSQFIDSVDPVNGIVVNRVHATVSERMALINQARSSSFYNVSEDSFVRNLEYGDIPTNVEILAPKSSPINIPSIKGKEKVMDNFDDIPLGPVEYDVGDNWSSGSRTPKPGDYDTNTTVFDDFS